MNKPETQLQKDCLEYLCRQYHNAWENTFHPKNETKNGHWDSKFMGNSAGVMDLFTDIPRNGLHGFRAELKCDKNKVKNNQTDWIAREIKNGYYVCVCYSLDDYIKHCSIYFG